MALGALGVALGQSKTSGQPGDSRAAEGDNRYAGASYGYDDSKYGVPIVKEGQIRLTPRRHAVTFRTGAQNLAGVVSSYRATFGVKRYDHDELEGDQVGTHFDNDTEEAELLVSHRPVGRLSGAVGGWFLNRGFKAIGAEALSPPVDQRGAAVFLYEELGWGHVTVQFGGRLDHTKFEPEGGLPARSFNEFSGSLGLLYSPVIAKDNFVIAISFARAARNPALEDSHSRLAILLLARSARLDSTSHCAPARAE